MVKWLAHFCLVPLLTWENGFDSCASSIAVGIHVQHTNLIAWIGLECRNKANCQLVGPRTVSGVPFVGVFLSLIVCLKNSNFA